MYSISICDADERARDSLEEVINRYFKSKDILVKIRKFDNFREMQRSYKIVDIVFIDAKTINNADFCLLEFFVRSNPYVYLYILGDSCAYLGDIDELCTFRYIEKPVGFKQLYHSLDRIIDMQKDVAFMSNYLPVTLKENEIVCIYSLNRRTYVLTDLGIVYPTIISVKEWQRKVRDIKSFCQPHYSYIINRRFIYSFSGNEIVLQCKNGKAMSVYPSQRRMGEIRNNYYTGIRPINIFITETD